MYIIQTIKGQFECYTGQHCSSESQELPETLTFFIQVFIPKAAQLCTFQNLEQDGTLYLCTIATSQNFNKKSRDQHFLICVTFFTPKHNKHIYIYTCSL